MIATAVLLLVSGALILSVAALWHGLWMLAAAVLLVTAPGPLCLRGSTTPACADGLLICASALSGIGMLEGLPAWIPIASLSLFLFSWNTARIHASRRKARVSRREERRAATRVLLPAACLTAALSAGLDCALRGALALRFETALLLAVGSLVSLGAFLMLLRRQIAPPSR